MNKLDLKNFADKSSYNINDLITLVRILRNPEYGCSWDREQTHLTVRHNFVEEVYEVLDAIDSGRNEMLCEELGDTLLQVCLHTEMEYEKGTFTFEDVCDGICKKLIYRHPHIFADITADSTEQVLSNWEQLKRIEKGHDSTKDAVDGIARALPALMYTKKLQKLLSHKPDTETALDNIAKSLDELRLQSSTDSDCYNEIGRLLFDVVSVARAKGCDPELALMDAAKSYRKSQNTE